MAASMHGFALCECVWSVAILLELRASGRDHLSRWRASSCGRASRSPMGRGKASSAASSRGPAVGGSAAGGAQSTRGKTTKGTKTSSETGGRAACYEKERAGHGVCVVCARHSRQVKWAAVRTDPDKDDDDTTPLGNLCHACFIVYVAMRASHKFGCPNDFVRKVYQDRDFRQKVLHANEVSDGKAKKGAR